MYGYCDENKNILIAPQYSHVDFFTSTGYAVVKNEQGLFGVINQANKVIVSFRFLEIDLYVVRRYTVASVMRNYTVKTRFWEWKLFPNINFLSRNSSFLPVIDRGSLREKRTVFLLDNKKILKVKKTTIAHHYSRGEAIPIKSFSTKFLQIDEDLYKAKKKRFKKILSNFIGTCDHGLKLVRKVRSDKVRVYNHKGKRVKSYEIIQSCVFPITYKGKEHLVYFKTNESLIASPPVIYRDTKGNGRFYVNEQFDMPLPVHLKKIDLHTDRPLVDIWRNVVNIIPVVSKHFFLIEVKPDRVDQLGSNFYVLSRLGTLTDYIPQGTAESVLSFIGYNVVNLMGEVIWPKKEEIVSGIVLEAGETVINVECISEVVEPVYIVTVKRGEHKLKGMWNANKKDWVLSPKYNSLRLLSNLYSCKFQLEKNGLFGIISLDNKVISKPAFDSIYRVKGKLVEVGVKNPITMNQDVFFINLDTKEEYCELSASLIQKQGLPSA
ncbi:WG repeat-containing protein [Myroides injenensis]|uniref:WG repeat-containing protein n=1 Tax=Myroides injenensis TaxID=1183151 RepID=UPI000289E53B|nr:WG repeat-containing protein [Myroides injenensis]